MNWSAFLWTALWVVVGLIVLSIAAWATFAAVVYKNHKKVMTNIFKGFDDQDPSSRINNRLR